MIRGKASLGQGEILRRTMTAPEPGDDAGQSRLDQHESDKGGHEGQPDRPYRMRMIRPEQYGRRPDRIGAPDDKTRDQAGPQFLLAQAHAFVPARSASFRTVFQLRPVPMPSIRGVAFLKMPDSP